MISLCGAAVNRISEFFCCPERGLCSGVRNPLHQILCKFKFISSCASASALNPQFLHPTSSPVDSVYEIYCPCQLLLIAGAAYFVYTFPILLPSLDLKQRPRVVRGCIVRAC